MSNEKGRMFHRPGKQAAFEKAQRFTESFDAEFLASDEAIGRLVGVLCREFLALPLSEIQEIAALVLRMKREERCETSL